MKAIGKTLGTYQTCLVPLILILFLSGCSSLSHLNPLKIFSDPDLGTFGPEPLIEPDVFQRIDLVLLLAPVGGGVKS